MEREGRIIKTLPLGPHLNAQESSANPHTCFYTSHLGLETPSGLLSSSFLTKIVYEFLTVFQFVIKPKQTKSISVRNLHCTHNLIRLLVTEAKNATQLSCNVLILYEVRHCQIYHVMLWLSSL